MVAGRQTQTVEIEYCVRDQLTGTVVGCLPAAQGGMVFCSGRAISRGEEGADGFKGWRQRENRGGSRLRRRSI